MKKVRHLSFITSILVVVFYLTFTILAYKQYSLPYSPVRNWLSDLGSTNLNPNGAGLYNIGIISTALFLILFFLGLYIWKCENNKIQNVMLLLTQGFGVLGSMCMIISAIYPIDLFGVHSFWSTSLYILLSTAFAFSVAAFRYYPKFPKWLLILGLSTTFMVILTSFMKTVFLLEWITVVLFLGYVFLVGIETRRMLSRSR